MMIRRLWMLPVAATVCGALALSEQRPDDADVHAAVEQSRQRSLAYSRSLPDFVCTEIVTRSYDPRERAIWRPLDKLTIKLSYFGQKENHKLELVDDKPTDQTYETLQGAIGVGEFGATLKSIFDPASQAAFHWQSWKTVRRHAVGVYSYVVPVEHSSYVLLNGTADTYQKAVVGFHGQIEIERDTGDVFHFTYDADKIPKALKMDYVHSSVDYNFADVGGRQYLLPASSETEVHSPGSWRWNQIQFRQYRKFGTESTISFGPDK
jgi:hypothetical protein